MTRAPLLIVLAICLLALPACRSAQGPDVYAGRTSATVGAYEAAFDAGKDVLRDLGFELDRIDARAGVITTRSRAGSGLATPWIPTEEPLNDLAHRNRRRATLVFSPADAPPTKDLRLFAGSIDVECRIEVERAYQPGRRPSPTSVRLGGSWRDRDLPEGSEQVRYAKVIDTDEELAGRAIDMLLDRLATTP